MNKLVTYGIGAAAVVVLIFAGAQFFGSPGGLTGAEPSPTATPQVTVEPTSTPLPTPPPLTQTFISTQHGYSVSYPAGWTADAATEPWTSSTFPLSFGSPEVDTLSDPILNADLFLIIASQPIGDSAPDDWITEQMTSDEGCGTASLLITVDGATGRSAEDCTIAFVTTAGRGYWIQLYTGGDDPFPSNVYNKAWFEEVLATVQLMPGDAVD